MAAGKTTVGRCLADLQHAAFIDLDRKIEQHAGVSVPAIFEQCGETAFRDLEHRCLEDTEVTERVVVATGGGTMAFARNREVIGRLGVSIWLDPGLDTLLERLARSRKADRPLYGNEEQTRELYHTRLDAYRMANLRARVPSGGTAQSVAASIDLLLRERSCVI